MLLLAAVIALFSLLTLLGVLLQHPWTPESLLVMHSDGLRSNWDWNHFRNDLPRQPNEIAQRLLAELAKIDDDATVIVVKGAA